MDRSDLAAAAIPSTIVPAPLPGQESTRPMRQLLLELLPAITPSLENFVPGSNEETLTGLLAWLHSPKPDPLLLLWGDTGSGKTHLLQAACQAEQAPYLDARQDPQLATWPEGLPLVAVDHVDALDGAGQIALFNAFNRQKAGGGRLLVASPLPPRQLPVREDLRTRLGSGLIYRLHPLTDREKRAALAALADARKLSLPADALDYLILHAPRDMGSLTALLGALDRVSLERKRPITRALLRELLSQTPAT